MKENSRGFAILSVLIIISVVSFIGYVLFVKADSQNSEEDTFNKQGDIIDFYEFERSGVGSQSHIPDPNSNLVTYTNNKHSFSFKYPNSATFEEEGAKPNYYTVTEELDNNSTIGDSYYQFRIGLVSLFNNENTAEKYASKVYESGQDSGKCPSEESNSELTLVNFSDKKAYSYKSSCGTAESTIYYTEHNGGIYYINFTSKASGAQKKLAEASLDQILSTLRFDSEQ